MSSVSFQRRCGVAKAWENERKQVMNSHGSRNWTQEEQKQILATGRAAGYEGQHMMSVSKHPEQASNPNNIQFLTHDEHFKAHGGNWKNDANGRYNRKTGQVEKFKGNDPGKTNYRKLTNPLTDRQKKIADNKYQANRTENINHESIPKVQKVKVNKTESKTNDNSSMNSKREMFNKKMAGESGDNSARNSRIHSPQKSKVQSQSM